MARRAMLLGLNQVIMMAFAIVVLAALVGTGGLGQRVVDGLEKVDVGLAFAPGLAIVLAAISLDRISTGDRPATPPSGRSQPIDTLRVGLGDRALALVIAVAARLPAARRRRLPDRAGGSTSPDRSTTPSTWVNDHLRNGVPVVGGTGSFSDFLVIHVLDPVRDVLVDSPWWAVVAAVVAIGWASGGWRLGRCAGPASSASPRCATGIWRWTR